MEFADLSDVGQVIHGIERRNTVHHRDGNNGLQGFDDLEDIVVAVFSPHRLVGLGGSIEGNVQTNGRRFFDRFNQAVRFEAIGKQVEVGMVFGKPGYDFPGLRMKEKFAAFESYLGIPADTAVFHQTEDFVHSQVLDGAFLPDEAMLATGITEVSGIDHQRGNAPLRRKQRIVKHPSSPLNVIPAFVHRSEVKKECHELRYRMFENTSLHVERSGKIEANRLV